METQTSSALVVGVTGMLGLSLCEALKKPTALGGPWAVYGVSRRAMPTWFSPSLVDSYMEFDLLDSESSQRELSPLSRKITHVFWLSLKVCETEDESIATNSKTVHNVLKALTCTKSSTIRHFSLVTGTKQYLGPIFDPVLSSQVVPHEPPFVEDMQRLPVPNMYHALEDLLASYSPKFTRSIHRSSVILGASGRSSYNMVLNLAVYALICKKERSPFRFPGNKFSWEHFFDASDAELIADQQIWAAVSVEAKDQAFNCTNGDIYTWKNLWKLFCEIFGLEFVPFEETDRLGWDWVEEMKGKASVWDAIVEENMLAKMKLEEAARFDAVYIFLNMNVQHVCSMTKSREFGFHGFADTFKRVRKWVEVYKEMNIIPKE